MNEYKNSFKDGGTRFDVVITFDETVKGNRITVSVTATNKYYFRGKKESPEELLSKACNHELLHNVTGRDAENRTLCDWVRKLIADGAFLPEKDLKVHKIMKSENKAAPVPNLKPKTIKRRELGY